MKDERTLPAGVPTPDHQCNDHFKPMNLKGLFRSDGMGRRVAKDFLGLLVERGARFLVGFAITAMIARHLGAELFGELSFGLAVGAIGAGVAQLGFDTLVMRDLARVPSKALELLTTALALRTAALIAVWIVLGAIAFFTAKDSGYFHVLLVLGLTAMAAITGIPALWFQSQTMGRWPAWAGFGVFVVACGIRVLLVKMDAGLLAFAWVAVGEIAATGGATAIMLVRKKPAGASPCFSREIAAGLMREAWPLWISGLAVTVYMRVDQVLLRSLAGSDQLGIYSAALRITEQSYLVPMTLAVPMLGILATQNEASGERAALVERYFAGSALAAYGFIGFVWMVAPWVYTTFFGHGFGEAGLVARVQVLGAPFVFIGVARSQVFVIQGLVRLAMWSTLAGAAVNVVANFALAPKLGALGAAWASVAAQATAAWLTTWCHPEARPLAWAQTRALLSPWRAFGSKNS